MLNSFVRRRDGYVSEDCLLCDMDEWEQRAAVGGRSVRITKTANHFRYSLASLAIIRGSIIEHKLFREIYILMVIIILITITGK